MDILKEQQSAISTAELAQNHAEKAIDYAIRSGEHLINVKAELPHGEFTPWVEEFMPICVHQCRSYMKVAKNKKFLNTSRASYLDGDNYSIRGALEAIKEKEYDTKVKEREAEEKERGKGKEAKREVYRETDFIKPDIDSEMYVGNVYIAECEGFHKIGATHGDVEKRRRQMQTGNPFKIRIVKTIECSHIQNMENKLHIKLEKYRGIGEWFKCDLETINSAIDSVIEENNDRSRKAA